MSIRGNLPYLKNELSALGQSSKIPECCVTAMLLYYKVPFSCYYILTNLPSRLHLCYIFSDEIC